MQQILDSFPGHTHAQGPGNESRCSMYIEISSCTGKTGYITSSIFWHLTDIDMAGWVDELFLSSSFLSILKVVWKAIATLISPMLKLVSLVGSPCYKKRPCYKNWTMGYRHTGCSQWSHALLSTIRVAIPCTIPGGVAIPCTVLSS